MHRTGSRVHHLLAYHKETEKMVWGIPLPLTSTGEAEYRLDRTAENITLQFMGEKNIHLINPSTGETTRTVALPYASKNLNDHLHLTPDGMGYQIVRWEGGKKLVGGPLSNSELDPAFEVEAPGGFFTPLSTHVGFHDDFEKMLILFGPL